MKISVFFDLYGPLHENKDLGQIPIGLMENSVTSSVITVTKNELDGHHSKELTLESRCETD